MKNGLHEWRRAIVIASFNSDSEKKEYLKDIKDEKARAIIIASLSGDDEKKEYLKDIKDEEARAIVIASFNSDNEKKEYLKDIKDEYNKAIIIASLSFEEDKKEQFDSMDDEEKYFEIELLDIVLGFSDKNKLEYLDKYDGELKLELIESFSDNQLKDKLRNEFLATLSEDERTHITLEFERQNNKRIYSRDNFENEAEAVEFLVGHSREREFTRAFKEIIAWVSDEKRIEILDRIGRIRLSLKAELIATIENEKTKKDLFNEFEKEIDISITEENLDDTRSKIENRPFISREKREKLEAQVEAQIKLIEEQEKELAELKKARSEKLKSPEQSSIGTEQH